MEQFDRADFDRLYHDCFSANRLERFDTPELRDRFAEFSRLFSEYNTHTNLSAIRNIEGMISKHFADCLLAESLFPESATVLDIGCGGGFPTFPLAIVRKDLQLTSVDSTGKKIAFVASAAKEMKLSNITPICARIEDAGLAKFKESFLVVTSRAVAALPVLCELALPFVKVGGRFVALKGAQGAEELAASQSAISALGGKLMKDQSVELVTEQGTELRHLIVIEKIKPTAPSYPRPYAQIIKKTL